MKSKLLFILLIVIWIFLLYIVASLDKFHNISSSIGYLVGYSIPLVIFLWIIPLWLFGFIISILTKKNYKLGKWATSSKGLMIGLIFISLYLLIAALNSKNRTNQDIDYLGNMAKGTQLLNESDKTLPLSTIIKEDNVVNIIAAAYKVASQKNKVAIDKVSTEYVSIEENKKNTFVPAQLTNPDQLNKARQILFDFKQYITDRDSVYKSFQTDFENELRNNNLLTSSFLEEYNTGKLESEKDLKSLDDVQNQSIFILNSLIQLIENNLNHFTIKNDVFNFEDPAAQREYIDLSAQILELTNKEAEITIKIQNNRNKLSNDLHNLK